MNSSKVKDLMGKIATVYNSLSDKSDAEVQMIYKSDKHVQPWVVRCDSRSNQGTDPEIILLEMLDKLTQELTQRAVTAEKQIVQYRKVLSTLGN